MDISDADAVEDDFQLAFDDNDPSGTDVFLLSVSRGDYHTGHHYVFFVLRKTTIAGTAMTDYAENGTAAIGTYTIASPDSPFSWELVERAGEGDMDDFSLLVNTDGESAVLSFASSPDFETLPTAVRRQTTSITPRVVQWKSILA